MALLLPTVAVETLLDITPELLASMGVDTVLLDVDNTLAYHGSQEPFPGTVEWTHELRSRGFRVMILSNNFAKRVAPFAEKYDLPFLSFSIKPLPIAYFRAIHKLGARREKAVVIGDQVFTDVLCANLAGAVSILVEPIELEPFPFFKLKRRLEKLVLRGGRKGTH